jgi:hypothetical protein
MSYESHKYYNGNLYASMAKYVKNQQLFMDLYPRTVMDVKKSTIKLICKYYNWCKKTSNYLQELYASIAMDIRKLVTIYETYVWVLHIWNGFMEIIVERM